MLQLSFVNFKRDSYLLVEGKENNDRFFIIQSGKVRTFRSGDLTGVSEKVLGPGDFVGVIPCMSGHSQIENAVALADTRCISVLKDQYPELIEKNTPIALKIIRTFANRMRTMNELLTSMTSNNVSSSTAEQIFDVASYYDKVGNYATALYAYYHYMKECREGEHLEQAQTRFKILSTMSDFREFERPADLTRSYNQGEMIFAENQTGADMFVIQDGEVAITKVVNGNEVILALLKRGDMFGEMSLLENKPRSASAIAHQNCRLMVINRSNFDQMVTTQPQLIARLTTMFAERLWTSYRQQDNANLVSPLHKMVDMLALQMEKAKRFIGSYQTELTPVDLANMCGIPLEQHTQALSAFYSEHSAKVNANKIFIPDCGELRKQAAFYRKMNAQQLEKELKEQKSTVF